MKADTAATTDREIVISRVFDAPREIVFEAFIHPEQVKQWWGPNGFTTTTHEMDVRPGGVWLFTMHGPDGRDYYNVIRYVEIARPERLVYDHGSDEHSPLFHATVTFVDVGGKTEVTLHSVFETAEERNRVVEEHGAIEGGKQTLGRLAEFLAAKMG